MSQTLFTGILMLNQCLPQHQGLVTPATSGSSSGRPGGTQGISSHPWTLQVECMGRIPWQLIWMKELYHQSLPLSADASSSAPAHPPPPDVAQTQPHSLCWFPLTWL